MLSVFLKGLMTAISLIVAIGAQNTFVLKQGLMRRNVFATCLVCVLCDFSLMFFGVYSISYVQNKIPILEPIFMYGGCIFIAIYGLMAFRSSIRGQSLKLANDSNDKQSIKQAVIMALAITLLNPHVYIDTVFLIGSIGARYNDSDKFWFALGCAFASLIWFFSLGYGARVLSPLFKKEITWRILDFCIGVMMFAIVYSLLSSFA